jgi:hypothetical protein
MTATIHISFVHQDGDSVRVQIVTKELLLCVEMTPDQFSRSLMTGQKINVPLIRFSTPINP